MNSFYLLCGLLLAGGCTHAAWLPIRLDSGAWAALREAEPGREYWLRPQCRLKASETNGCNNDWLVTVTFWSWSLLASAERGLQSAYNISAPVTPFQGARLDLLDQRGQWSSSRSRFINGLLPASLQFRLRPQTQNRSCSFETGALVVELLLAESDRRSGAKVQGFQVRSAYWGLLGSRPAMSVDRAASRLSQLLVRQAAVKAPLEAAKRLERQLSDWAGWQQLQDQQSGRRYRSRGAEVFARFPSTARLPLDGESSADEVLRFSILPASTNSEAPKLPLPNQDNTQAELASLRQRLEALEAAKAAPCPTNCSSSSRSPKPEPKSSVPRVTDCAEAPEGLVFLPAHGRFARCSDKGELIVLQRAKGGLGFNRSFAEYRRGFGDARKGDYWLGLDFLSTYTALGDMCARVQLTPWLLSINNASIQYSDFEVGPLVTGFRLGYSNSRSAGTVKDALIDSRGAAFSTFDHDQDTFVGNCARVFSGGGWFRSCARANVFGKMEVLTSRGMCWRGVHPSQGDMCSPLTGISLALRKSSTGAGSKKVVFSYIEERAANYCQPMHQVFVVKGKTLFP